MSDGEYLSLKEVARLLGLSERTVYRRVKDGTLPAAKIGGVWRVRKADLDRLFPTPRGRGLALGASEPARSSPSRYPDDPVA